MDHAYVGFILCGSGVGVVLLLLGARGAGVPVDRRLIALTGVTLGAGLAGARLYALIEMGAQWHLLGWHLAAAAEGGFRLPGAVAGLLIGFVSGRGLFVRDVSLGVLADLGVVAAEFAFAVVRLGCLADGCCFGVVTDLPWAVRFPPGSQAATVHAALGLTRDVTAASLPVHPLQIYFLLLHVGIAGFLVWLRRHKRYDGQLLLLGVLLGQMGKAGLESFRQPIPGVPTAHLRVASLALAAAAVAALIVIPRLARKPLNLRQTAPTIASGAGA